MLLPAASLRTIDDTARSGSSENQSRMNSGALVSDASEAGSLRVRCVCANAMAGHIASAPAITTMADLTIRGDSRARLMPDNPSAIRSCRRHHGGKPRAVLRREARARGPQLQWARRLEAQPLHLDQQRRGDSSF